MIYSSNHVKHEQISVHCQQRGRFTINVSLMTPIIMQSALIYAFYANYYYLPQKLLP